METHTEVVEEASDVQDSETIPRQLCNHKKGMGRARVWIHNGIGKPVGTVTKGGGDREHPGLPPTEECDNSPQKRNTDETRRMVQRLSETVSPL